MDTDAVVTLGRQMLQEVLVLTAPILLAAILVSLVVNVFQVLTSLQDQTVSTVPRLFATGATIFIMMPWMWRHLGHYTTALLSDFHKVLQ
ncbi:MAG: flagellar biosynthetic protein FliQ [Acidobacteriota bacterium]|nr:flagellar biosynthetic protein FliQ [Acidobacteriota bacterium]